MKRAKWVRDAVAAGNAFHWTKQSPAKHNAINLAATAVVLGVFALLIVWGATANPWLYIPVAGVLYGVLYFGVNVLIIHECSHNMYLLSADRPKSKRWNNLVGRVAGLLFFTDYVRHWEKGHTVHHLRPCEDDDPQDKDPMTGPDLYKLYAILALVPLSFMALNPSRQYDGQLIRAAKGLAVWGPLFLLTGYFLSWQIPVAMVVGFHVVMVLNLSKKAQEHGCGLKYEEDPYLRSRTYLYPLSFLFSPFNINYHFEHHANFNVPWYLLPTYHETLRGIVPKEIWPYYFHHEYLAQAMGKKPLVPEELRYLLTKADAPAAAPAK
ncbi:MAG: fatty acid desaturase [Alphaproteobacteria bacterium]|nr:fatty acid desaturase [Alphaproteobacteria bacterium]